MYNTPVNRGRDFQTFNLKVYLNIPDIYPGHTMIKNPTAHGLCPGVASAGATQKHIKFKGTIWKPTTNFP
jgi:hypothetical protein